MPPSSRMSAAIPKATTPFSLPLIRSNPRSADSLPAAAPSGFHAIYPVANLPARTDGTPDGAGPYGHPA